MNKIWLLLSLLALTACGGGDKSTSASALAGTDQPNVLIPTDRAVIVTDYVCTELRDYTDADGRARQGRTDEKGVVHYWKDSGYSLTYDEATDGSYKILSKYQRYTLDGGQYRLSSEYTHWRLRNGSWSKTVEEIERVWRVDGNVRHVVSNKVNGADQPYYWDIEDTTIDAKTRRHVDRHTNPGARDHDGLHYTKIEKTCIDTDR